MNSDRIKVLGGRLASLHRQLRTMRQAKQPISLEVDVDIQNELKALELELRVTPKDETDRILFVKLCGDVQTTLIDYVTLKEALEQVPVLSSPKSIDNLSEVILLEKQAAFISIEQDLTQLQEIALDLSELVVEQKKPLREVEQQVEVAAAETVRTEAELEKASEYQNKWRRKCCLLWLAGCVVIVGAALVVTGSLVL